VLEVEQPFFRGAAKWSPMRVSRAAEIGVPGVEMSIEMDQGQRPEASDRRSEQR